MSKVDRYPAQVFWSAEDDGFIAVASDLPGCSAFGETQAEALAELQDAIRAWIEAATAAGNSIPRPSTPAEKSTFSGKLHLRMPKDLHRSLSMQASEQGVSLNQYIVYLLSSSPRGVSSLEKEYVKNLHVGEVDLIMSAAFSKPNITKFLQGHHRYSSSFEQFEAPLSLMVQGRPVSSYTVHTAQPPEQRIVELLVGREKVVHDA